MTIGDNGEVTDFPLRQHTNVHYVFFFCRRVTNMEGGHKPSCLQGKAKSTVRRGTNPFRVNRAKEKDVSLSRIAYAEMPG